MLRRPNYDWPGHPAGGYYALWNLYNNLAWIMISLPPSTHKSDVKKNYIFLNQQQLRIPKSRKLFVLK
jgi:hypothetical protein